MCEVIALTPPTISRHVPAGGSAEILFFMGVRYHRMSDDEFEKATRKPARKGKATRQVRHGNRLNGIEAAAARRM